MSLIAALSCHTYATALCDAHPYEVGQDPIGCDEVAAHLVVQHWECLVVREDRCQYAHQAVLPGRHHPLASVLRLHGKLGFTAADRDLPVDADVRVQRIIYVPGNNFSERVQDPVQRQLLSITHWAIVSEQPRKLRQSNNCIPTLWCFLLARTAGLISTPYWCATVCCRHHCVVMRDGKDLACRSLNNLGSRRGLGRINEEH